MQPVEITMEVFTEIGLGLSVWTHDIECRVHLEPDESSGDTTYYISGVDIYGRDRGQEQRYYALQERHPLYAQIREYAYKYHGDELDDRWGDYLGDLPRNRRPLTDKEEHGTLRANAL